MVNSFGFKGILCFLNLANIIVNLLRKQRYYSCPIFLSADSGDNFRQLSLKGREGIAERQRRCQSSPAAYLAWRQLSDCVSIPRSSAQRMSHPAPGSFSNVRSIFICADGL